MEQTIQTELQLEPVTFLRSENVIKRRSRVDALTRQVTLWDYIPSQRCVVELFDTSHSVAHAVINNILTIKRAWKSYTCAMWDRIRTYRANRRAKHYQQKYIRLPKWIN